MIKVVLLISGGAIGTLARYSVSGAIHRWLGSSFPMGTLAVNIIGSFIIGFLWGLFEREYLSPNVRSFLFIGVLGGFTTFSSFSLETFNLFREGETKWAILNILANNLIGLLMVFAGLILARAIKN
ncbi:MAG TPA: fluoride efflux transporter CrcB [Cyclobacteriaceae bacterium]|nr:fluoride efflux transporter CrcB [Cyclobacteriaceae bacterium]